MDPGNKIIMLSRNIKAGQYKWQPKTIKEATALVLHLQDTIRVKDKRYMALQRENDLLYDRISALKKLFKDIGLKTV